MDTSPIRDDVHFNDLKEKTFIQDNGNSSVFSRFLYVSDRKMSQMYIEFEGRRFDYYWSFVALFMMSSCFFFLLNSIFGFMWSKVKIHSEKPTRALVNNSVSLVHSIIAAFVVHYDYKYLTPIMLEDLRNIHSCATLFLIAFSGGYFLYDLIDIRHTAAGRALFELFCHHAIIITNYSYVLFRREYVPFCAAFLFCETNSVFLHCRQLMLYNKVPKNSIIFRVNAIFNYVTFLIYRLWNCFWLLSYMCLNFAEMSWEVRFLMVASVPAITIVQLPLLYRIIYSDWFKLHTANSKMNFD